MMKTWQKNYLLKHMDKLVENTVCTAGLLCKLMAAGVIDKFDADKLEAQAENFARNKLLYELLMIRKYGYNALITALSSCRQNEAVSILVKGVYQNGIHELYVNISGKLKQIKECLDEEEICSLVIKLKETLSEKEFLDFCLEETDEENKALKLITDNLPPQLSYYIPRWISNRVKVDPNFFKQVCPDVFVFKGISHVKLSQLAATNGTSSSGRQIIKPNSSRFILLESDEDWVDISLHSKGPVHLINFDTHENAYLLEGTSGESKHLQMFLIRKEREQAYYLTEDDFIEKRLNDKSSSGVCICDAPGMGKTLLLASLARKIYQNYDDNLVSFIRLQKFGMSLGNKRDPNKGALSTLLEQICLSPSHMHIFTAFLTKNTFTLHVFFDGFDEIRDNITENLTKDFLKSIVKFAPKVQIYLTSRPHMKQELEQTLGVISYDIFPFNNSNQIEFLVKYWTEKIARFQEGLLKKFVELCLKNARKDLRGKDKEIISIPLQCYILAEVYLPEARVFSRSVKSNYHPDSSLTTCTSTFQLYERFFEMKFENTEAETHLQMKHRQFKDFHVNEALKLLCPELLQHITVPEPPEKFSVADILSYGILQTQGDSNQVEFGHNTFAEFLVAEFLVDMFVEQTPSNQENKRRITAAYKFWTQYILKKYNTPFGYSFSIDNGYENHSAYLLENRRNHREFATRTLCVLSWFVNGHLQSKSEKGQTGMLQLEEPEFQNFLKPAEFFLLLHDCISKNQCYILDLFNQILNGCPKDQHYSSIKDFLFREKIREYFFGDDIDQHVNTEAPEFCKTYSYNLLHSAGKLSNRQMVENYCHLCRECFDYDLASMFNQIPTHLMTPLHFAARKADYELVEYFLHKISLTGRRILYHSVAYTHGETEEKIKCRVAICEILISNDPSIINEEADEIGCKTPLMSPTIHLELIKFLVEKGINVNVTSKPKEYMRDMNIAMLASHYMSSSEFHELTTLLIEKYNAAKLFKANPKEKIFPLHFILGGFPNLKVSPKLETLNLILDSDPDIKINDKDGDWDNILFNAIIGFQPDIIVKELIKRGGNFDFVNQQGENVLHLAANYSTPEMVRFFCEKGISIDAKDNDGNIPLQRPFDINLRVRKAFEKIKILIEAGSDIRTTNKNGDTFVHGAADCSPQFPEIVRYCLEELKEVGFFTAKNNDGYTPLRLYLKQGMFDIDDETVNTLLHIPRYDVNEVTGNGDNLIFTLVRRHANWPTFSRTLDVLIQAGVNINHINHDGKNIIHIAVIRDEFTNPVDTLQYFLNRKVDPNVKDKHGDAPLDLAKKLATNMYENEYDKVVSILKNCLK